MTWRRLASFNGAPAATADSSCTCPIPTAWLAVPDSARHEQHAGRARAGAGRAGGGAGGRWARPGQGTAREGTARQATAWPCICAPEFGRRRHHWHSAAAPRHGTASAAYWSDRGFGRWPAPLVLLCWRALRPSAGNRLSCRRVKTALSGRERGGSHPEGPTPSSPSSCRRAPRRWRAPPPAWRPPRCACCAWGSWASATPPPRRRCWRR